MHPRNIYKKRVDLKQLGTDHPHLCKYLKIELSGKAAYDFQNPEALAELTKTLLKQDFNLVVDIPITRLVPTLPLRLNYILWIEDLVKAACPSDQNITGVDIGTGASCIYPLLAAKRDWKMLATEVDKKSLDVARKNVEANSLSHLIEVKEVSGSDRVLVNALEENTIYHFTMCNPPFFAPNVSPSNRTEHRPPPKNAATGSPSELSTDGGEVDFITKMIRDSEVLKEKVRIFTTMVGRKCDLSVLKKRIKEANVKSVVETTFCQGKTSRWFLAWSFVLDLPEEVDEKKLQKQKTPVVWELKEGTSVADVIARLKELFLILEMEISPKTSHLFLISAKRDTWSNQRRKKREKIHSEDSEPPLKKAKPEEPTPMEVGDQELFLQFQVQVVKSQANVNVSLTWVSGGIGKDSVNQVLQFLKNNWKKK